jgi:hypothetical protein
MTTETTNETLLSLTDDELAVLVVHKLIEGKVPRPPGHDDARRMAIEVMDWLSQNQLLSQEENDGWKELRAS